MVTLKSRRFVLRPFRRGDEESLQANINNPNIYRYTLHIPYPYTMKDAREWVDSNLKSRKDSDGSRIHFALDMGGEVVGSIGLTNIDGHKAEVGYWLAEKHWNKGIMPKALSLVEKYAFGEMGLRRIYAKVFEPNKRSVRALEKSGYSLEGEMRKEIVKDGKYYDVLLYSKVI